jgi:hypothetical protein
MPDRLAEIEQRYDTDYYVLFPTGPGRHAVAHRGGQAPTRVAATVNSV